MEDPKMTIKEIEQKMQTLAVTKGMLEKELKELNIPEETFENISTQELITEIERLEKVLKDEGIIV